MDSVESSIKHAGSNPSKNTSSNDSNLAVVTGSANNASYFEEVTKKWVDRLFQVMAHTYEWHWREKLAGMKESEQEIKTIWYEHLKGYKKTGLIRAMTKIKSKEIFSTRAPTLSEMKWLCKTQPEDLGFPSDEEAFQMFSYKKQRMSAPVFHATNHITAYNVRQYPAKEARRIFIEAYTQVISEIDNGNMDLCKIAETLALPDKAPELMHEHDDIKGCTAHLDRMFKLLGRKSNRATI